MRVLVVAEAHDDDGGVWIDVDGELAVLPVPQIPGGALPHDGPSGFVSLDSMDAASLVAVTDLDISPHVLIDYVHESLVRHRAWDAEALLDMAARLAAEMLDIARQFPVGTVLTVGGSSLTAHIPMRQPSRPPVCDRGRRDARGH